MKPRNFPGRQERRWARAFRREHGRYPEGYIDYPTDVRIRMGAVKRKEEWHRK